MGLEYLIRGFIISKMLLMVELFNKAASKKDTSGNNYGNILHNIGVMGHA
jgi:hypothetical protein